MRLEQALSEYPTDDGEDYPLPAEQLADRSSIENKRGAVGTGRTSRCPPKCHSARHD